MATVKHHVPVQKLWVGDPLTVLVRLAVRFSNMCSYALLHQRGGIWVDIGVVCLPPIDFALSPVELKVHYLGRRKASRA